RSLELAKIKCCTRGRPRAVTGSDRIRTAAASRASSRLQTERSWELAKSKRCTRGRRRPVTGSVRIRIAAPSLLSPHCLTEQSWALARNERYGYGRGSAVNNSQRLSLGKFRKIQYPWRFLPWTAANLVHVGRGAIACWKIHFHQVDATVAGNLWKCVGAW